MAHQTILVLDFGSQFTQLIARRLRELSVYCEILPFNTSDRRDQGQAAGRHHPVRRPEQRRRRGRAALRPRGPRPRRADARHLLRHAADDAHARRHARPLGASRVRPRPGPPRHGDLVAHVEGHAGRAEGVGEPRRLRRRGAAGICGRRHQQQRAGRRDGSAGARLLRAAVPSRRSRTPTTARRSCATSPSTSAAARGDWTIASFIDEATARITAQVGDGQRRVRPVGRRRFDGRGLADSSRHRRSAAVHLRGQRAAAPNEAQQVVERYKKLQLPVHHVDATDLFLDRLAGVTDPEQKRKIIGGTFIDVFETRRAELGDFDFLAQGTLYPDVIESVSVRGPSATIKSHHNVGGLPEGMKFKLVEPLRELFKDEVRARRPRPRPRQGVPRPPAVPGPGLAVRILGEITRDKIALLQQADAIVADEVRKAGLVRAPLAKLRRAAAGAERRRDGRRAHLRVHGRDPRGREPRRHDRRLGAAAARSARRRSPRASSTKCAASIASSTTSARSRPRRSSGNRAERRR